MNSDLYQYSDFINNEINKILEFSYFKNFIYPILVILLLIFILIILWFYLSKILSKISVKNNDIIADTNFIDISSKKIKSKISDKQFIFDLFIILFVICFILGALFAK